MHIHLATFAGSLVLVVDGLDALMPNPKFDDPNSSSSSSSLSNRPPSLATGFFFTEGALLVVFCMKTHETLLTRSKLSKRCTLKYFIEDSQLQ